jgi:hypothetical protein
MKSHHADDILRRLERGAVILGDESAWQPSPAADVPRWRIDARWIEFECGCRAERCRTIRNAKKFDPIIFENLPEQALYDYVCHFHEPSMNKRLGIGGFKTFDAWKRLRRPDLMRNL